MIEAVGLTKRYGEKTAVDGLTFTVRPGIVTGFLGPNGAGKSTTMRLILGLDRPTSGSVTVNGKPYAEHAAPLGDYVQRLMRGPSPLSVAQRELIGAYVSGLNACVYCHGVHTAISVAHGVEDQLVAALVDDLITAPIEERMRPLLGLVRTLTLTPAKVRDSAIAAVYAAGWDEQALHDAVSICGLFNMMNRLVEGLGITATPEQHRLEAQRLGGPAGYQQTDDWRPQEESASSAE